MFVICSVESRIMDFGVAHFNWPITHFSLTVNLNIRVISDVRTAMKTFRAKWRYSIRYRVLDRATNWKPNNTGRVRCNNSN